jgi:hypothetical protein
MLLALAGDVKFVARLLVVVVTVEILVVEYDGRSSIGDGSSRSSSSSRNMLHVSVYVGRWIKPNYLTLLCF